MLKSAKFSSSSSSSVSSGRRRQLSTTKASSSSSSCWTVSRLVGLVLLATAQPTLCAHPQPLVLSPPAIVKQTPTGQLDKMLSSLSSSSSSCGKRLTSARGESKEAVDLHVSLRLSSAVKTTVHAVRSSSPSKKGVALQLVSSSRWTTVQTLFCYRVRPARLHRSVVGEKKTGSPLMKCHSLQPQVVKGETPLRKRTSRSGHPVSMTNTAFCSPDTTAQLAQPNGAAVKATFLPHPEALSDNHSQFDVHPKWDSAPAVNSGRSLSVPDHNAHISFKVQTDYDQAHALMFGINQEPSDDDKVGDVLNHSFLHPPVALYLMPGCPFCEKVSEWLSTRVNTDKAENIQLRYTLNDDGTPNRFETELLEKTGGRLTQPVMELQGGALIGESSNIVKLLEEYFRINTSFSDDQVSAQSQDLGRHRQ